jgi:hypothetical protein
LPVSLMTGGDNCQLRQLQVWLMLRSCRLIGTNVMT